MKVTVSVGGKFHAFNLAEQLLKRGYLERLITSYPKFEAAKYGIPKKNVRSVLVMEVMNRVWRRFAPARLKRIYNPQNFLCWVYDRVAALNYGKSDLLVAWSSKALHTLRKARSMGATTIVERGSSHMLYQTQILTEEYEKYGLRPQVAHPKVVDKELMEYEEADYISVPSTFVRQTFLDRGVPEKKLIQVPYGADLSEFRQIPKEDGRFRVIHCGGMTLRKGVHYLLRAFHELDLPDSELWLIGAMSDEMRPFMKKYSGPKILHKGPYRQSGLYRYYSQGSVLVLMSLEEGLAMVQPQAMACGLPVICTTNTGGADIVRDGTDGFIIPIRDVESLKEKLLYFYKNPDARRQMGQSAKKRVAEGFTWDDYGKKIIEAYMKCLRGRTE